jgi:4-hydroxy-3-polyprenylbenzoate decarboxylase
MKQIVLAITGASGVIYGIRLLEALHNCPDVETHLILSEAAIWNIAYESTYSIEALADMAGHIYDNGHIWEAPASGSFPIDAMVICPCSMRTLAAIKNGFADNLISRAADVNIKENRKLILCPRETPLSAIHLDNMAFLAHLGVCILPPAPAFYQKPRTIDDLIAHHSMKVFDQLKLPFPDAKRWRQSGN